MTDAITDAYVDAIKTHGLEAANKAAIAGFVAYEAALFAGRSECDCVDARLNKFAFSLRQQMPAK